MTEDMRPLEAFPAEVRERIEFVRCDIDDTLTTDGRLLAASYSALEQLQNAGLTVLPITGRPAGATLWPRLV